MIEVSQLLSTAVHRAWVLAKQGRVASGYRTLSLGLYEARESAEWNQDLESLWRDAITTYEARWFPEDWHPLLRRGESRRS